MILGEPNLCNPNFPILPDLFPQELRQDRQVELQAVAGDFDRRLEELRGSLRREAEHARCWEAGRRGEVQERNGKKWVGLKA